MTAGRRPAPHAAPGAVRSGAGSRTYRDKVRKSSKVTDRILDGAFRSANPCGYCPGYAHAPWQRRRGAQP